MSLKWIFQGHFDCRFSSLGVGVSLSQLTAASGRRELPLPKDTALLFELRVILSAESQ